MMIRKGRKEDLEMIRNISSISLKSVLPMKYFEKYLKNILISVEKERIIGFLVFKNDSITSIAIHPKFRKKGVGKKLIEELMKKHKIIKLRTREKNRKAIDFFNNIGFKEKRKIEKYYLNGDNAIEIEWRK